MTTLLNLTKLLTRQASYREDEGDPDVETVAVSVARDAIRCFNPRNEGKPGTRLTFKDGGGFAVAESYEAVRAYYETGVLPAGANVAAIGNA